MNDTPLASAIELSPHEEEVFIATFCLQTTNNEQAIQKHKPEEIPV